jgi:hypothetical protein
MTHSFESAIEDGSPGVTRDERFRSILREEYRRRRGAPETSSTSKDRYANNIDLNGRGNKATPKIKEKSVLEVVAVLSINGRDRKL